jgi:hypothetical protein
MHLCAKYIGTKFYIFLISEGHATLVGTFDSGSNCIWSAIIRSKEVDIIMTKCGEMLGAVNLHIIFDFFTFWN